MGANAAEGTKQRIAVFRFVPLKTNETGNINNNNNIIGSRVSDVFSSYPYYESHVKGIVAGISNNELLFIDENLDIQTINWSS